MSVFGTPTLPPPQHRLRTNLERSASRSSLSFSIVKLLKQSPKVCINPFNATKVSDGISASKCILEGVDPEEYETKKASFYQSVESFHANKGLVYSSTTFIDGKCVDLYKLYILVTSRGGYNKVTSRGLWIDVAESYGLDGRGCVNVEQILKGVYLTHLSYYEKSNFKSQDDSNDEDDFERTSILSKDKLPSFLTTVSSARKNANVSAALREHFGLSPLVVQHSPYDSLMLSLLSGLPNDVDFAITICALLAHDSRCVLQLTAKPSLLEALLSHVGVFSKGPNSFVELSHSMWKKTGRDYGKFWRQCVNNQLVEALLSGDYNSLDCQWNKYDESIQCLMNSEPESGIFVNHKPGVGDCEGQRIFQMALILRNISVDPENARVMASNSTLFRFLLLCSSCKISPIREVGLDIFANIVEQTLLETFDQEKIHLLFSMLTRCITSDDKFLNLRGCEILSRLCQPTCNEDTIAENIPSGICTALCTRLSVQDIVLLIYVLEALYQLSELGETPAAHIAKTPGSIETLVDLVTIEAQSFGQEALRGLKIVEHSSYVQVPRHQAAATQAAAPSPHPAPSTPGGPFFRGPLPTPAPPMQSGGVSVVRAQPPQVAYPQPPQQQQQQPVLSMGPPPPPPVTALAQLVHQQPSTSSASRVPHPQTVYPAPSSPVVPPPGTTSPAPSSPSTAYGRIPPTYADSQQTFASQWVQATYEPYEGESVSCNDVYSDYVNAVSRVGTASPLNHQEFSRLFRNVFPRSDSRQSQKPSGQILVYQCNVRRREHALPLACMLQQQVNGLNSSPSPTDSTNSTMTKASQQHPSSPSSSSSSSSLSHRASSQNHDHSQPPNTLCDTQLAPKPKENGLISKHITSDCGNRPIDSARATIVNGHPSPNNQRKHEISESIKQKAQSLSDMLSEDITIKKETKVLNGILFGKERHTVISNCVNEMKPGKRTPLPEKCNGDMASTNKILSEMLDRRLENGPGTMTNGPTKLSDDQSKQTRLGSDSVTPSTVGGSILKQTLLDGKPPSAVNGGDAEPPCTAPRTRSKRASEESRQQQQQPAISQLSGVGCVTRKRLRSNSVESGVDQPQQQQQQQQQSPSAAVKAVAPAPPVAHSFPVAQQLVGDPHRMLYPCGWRGCGWRTKTGADMLQHVFRSHLTQDSVQTCRWEQCDDMPRQRLSLLTHIQDRHCVEAVLQQAALRKAKEADQSAAAMAAGSASSVSGSGGSSTAGGASSPTSLARQHHPGFAQNAAYQAIQRYSTLPSLQQFSEQKEGPVTKSIRITSALILRNLARYSSTARSRLRKHEDRLAVLALSSLDCSVAITQCLHDMEHPWNITSSCFSWL